VAQDACRRGRKLLTHAPHEGTIQASHFETIKLGGIMRTARLVAAAVLVLSAAIAWADEAEDAFKQLYGDDMKRVAATRSPADDIRLAKQLIEDAKKVEKQPELLAVLYEKAYQLASKDASGYATATEALNLLAARVPEKKIECLQKGAALYRKQYSRARGDAKAEAGESLIAALQTLAQTQAGEGDVGAASATLRQAIAVARATRSDDKAALQAQLANLALQQRLQKQIAALKAKLDANPADTVARKELVQLYLVDMDDPAGAAKAVDESLDEATRKYVPAAAKPLDKVPEYACKELGEWYRGLADQAVAPATKGAMLRRAQGYYQRFLDIHTPEDLARGTATLTLKKIGDQLAKLGAAAESKPTPPILTLNLGKGVTMKLLRIRPGKFTMGSPDSEQGRESNEGPQHVVTLSRSFYLGVTEVTQAQYEAVMGTNPSQFKGPTNPVERISWDDAVAFCRKLSKKTGRTFRLPTEAEWEYACRAGTRTRYGFGNDDAQLADYAWLNANSDRKTHPVGLKKPNAAGLFDMHGNVCEWCADWHGPYAAGSARDPRGPRSGTDRVLRGGTWGSGNRNQFRCAYRYTNVPTRRHYFNGFRCAVAP